MKYLKDDLKAKALINSEKQIISPELILAGNCIFTAVSEVTGAHITYKVTRDNFEKHKWYVRVLAGNNIHCQRDWMYIGMIVQHSLINIGWIPDYSFLHTKNSEVNKSDFKFKAMKYIVDSLPEEAKHVTLLHEGQCARCGRRLITPESIKLGLGENCRRLI